MQTFEFESIHSFDGDTTVISTDANTLQEAIEDLFGDGFFSRANYRLIDKYPVEVFNPSDYGFFLGFA